jgi:hypothetical protein
MPRIEEYETKGGAELLSDLALSLMAVRPRRTALSCRR